LSESQGRYCQLYAANDARKHSKKATDEGTASQRTKDLFSATACVARNFDRDGDENTHGDF
jgi:hypothetical protein